MATSFPASVRGGKPGIASELPNQVEGKARATRKGSHSGRNADTAKDSARKTLEERAPRFAWAGASPGGIDRVVARPAYGTGGAHPAGRWNGLRGFEPKKGS
jgi:hypothetical protein